MVVAKERESAGWYGTSRAVKMAMLVYHFTTGQFLACRNSPEREGLKKSKNMLKLDIYSF